jgi:predicted dithiol-disulfide oxidoreductase (DUF899 family)
MQHPIVSHDEWLAARKQLLAKEKELTRLRDQLAAERRALPWVKIEKPYVFDGPDGKETLADLFGGRSQLIIKHFMLGPGWTEGCVGCSFELDHIDGILVHLEHRDVSYVAVSRAPLAEIEAFKKRMGWHIKWVSSSDSDFNFDFHVSFRPGEIAKGEGYYNYEIRKIGIDRTFRPQRILQRRQRRRLSYLFVLRTWWRGFARHIPAPRPRPKGPRRDRPQPQFERLGSAPRPVR